MARLKKNSILNGASGALGDDFVLKQYKYGTVISAKPDMSRVKRSALQKLHNNNFALAAAYAKAINNDPVKYAAYYKKLKEKQDVYHYAIKEYYKKYVK